MTHSPAPWSVFQDPSLRRTIGTATGRICDMWGSSPAFYTAEDEDNENLILAAPELLEACEVANRFFEQNDDFTDNGEYPIPGFILDMRIAIKKARRGQAHNHTDLDTIDLDHDLGLRDLTSRFPEEEL